MCPVLEGVQTCAHCVIRLLKCTDATIFTGHLFYWSSQWSFYSFQTSDCPDNYATFTFMLEMMALNHKKMNGPFFNFVLGTCRLGWAQEK